MGVLVAHNSYGNYGVMGVPVAHLAYECWLAGLYKKTIPHPPTFWNFSRFFWCCIFITLPGGSQSEQYLKRKTKRIRYRSDIDQTPLPGWSQHTQIGEAAYLAVQQAWQDKRDWETSSQRSTAIWDEHTLISVSLITGLSRRTLCNSSKAISTLCCRCVPSTITVQKVDF